MPSVQRAHETFHDQNVVMLTISVDGEGAQAVKPFITQNQYTFPALVDPHMGVARAFGARGVPMTYVIDRQGMIVAHGFGEINVNSPAFRRYLTQLADQPHG